mmetsp:Transcript_68236/g.172644  ORF Transcript_68236/g.172644 Transcript_68236/m.172644 type:complete len:95 (+) Transcript_68236:57-341(+)
MAKRAAEDSAAAQGPEVSSKFNLPSGPAQLGATSADEALHGAWDSGKGKCRIGKDPITARLTYEEPLEDGERLHGWLDPVAGETSVWQGGGGAF